MDDDPDQPPFRSCRVVRAQIVYVAADLDQPQTITAPQTALIRRLYKGGWSENQITLYLARRLRDAVHDQIEQLKFEERS
jgi:nickel-dependent lactate racemase